MQFSELEKEFEAAIQHIEDVEENAQTIGEDLSGPVSEQLESMQELMEIETRRLT